MKVLLPSALKPNQNVVAMVYITGRLFVIIIQQYIGIQLSSKSHKIKNLLNHIALWNNNNDNNFANLCPVLTKPGTCRQN